MNGKIITVIVIIAIALGGVYFWFQSQGETTNTSVKNTKISSSEISIGECFNIIPTQFIDEVKKSLSSSLLTYPSNVTDQNIALIPLKGYKTTGYCLLYPSDWSIRIAGAEGMNLIFNEKNSTDTKQRLFLQITSRNSLTLAEADQATYGFELMEPDFIVDQDEESVIKKIINIGDKEVLFRTSEKDSKKIVRYFFVNTDTVYMLETSTEKESFGSDAYKEFLSNVEKIIRSIKFVR